MTEVRWAVSVFSSRESPATLVATIAAVRAACGDTPATIDVVVNGQRALADAMVPLLATMGASGGPTPRLWFVALGDKANAWNRYIEAIAPPAETYFFVDGYVRPEANSLARLAAALAADHDAWGASGVPSVGRSAARLREAMLAHGGLHGNLYALRRPVVDLFKARGFRIPLGLYRNDSLLSAVLMFGAAPDRHAWNPRRVAVVADATWDNDTLAPLAWRSAVTQWNRIRRQAQGDLENAAVRQHLSRERRPPEAIPRTAAALLERWRVVRPDEVRRLLRHPLRRGAAARVAAPRDWSGSETPPELCFPRREDG